MEVFEIGSISSVTFSDQVYFVCDKQEDVLTLLSELHDAGYSWNSGRSLLEEKNYYNGKSVKYGVYPDKFVTYAGLYVPGYGADVPIYKYNSAIAISDAVGTLEWSDDIL